MPILNVRDLKKGSEGAFVNVTDLPDVLPAGKITKIEEKLDKSKAMALFLQIEMPNGKYTVQKYTDTLKRALAEKLEALKVTSIVEGQWYAWEKSREGKAIFDRFFPTAVVEAPAAAPAAGA
jgi:hypothetical protein